MILRLFIAALTALFLFPPTTVRADPPIFSAREGVAIGGYDVVAFFDEQRAVSGSAAHAIMWKGVIWQFVSDHNQARFEANPRAYAPVFGGYCAYAMSQGYLAPGNPELWVMEAGELLLLNNSSVHATWQGDGDHLMQVARENWPGVLRD